MVTPNQQIITALSDATFETECELLGSMLCGNTTSTGTGLLITALLASAPRSQGTISDKEQAGTRNSFGQVRLFDSCAKRKRCVFSVVSSRSRVLAARAAFSAEPTNVRLGDLTLVCRLAIS